MIRRYRPYVGILLIAAVGFCGESLWAKQRHAATGKKTEAAAPATSTAVAPTARLRCWKVTEIPTTPPPNLRISAGGKPAASDVITLQPGRYDFQNYVDVPSGVLVADLAMPEDKTFATPQKTTFLLSPGGAATLLIRQTSSGATLLEVIDDAAPAFGDLTVFNFLPPNLGDVQIAMGDVMSARLAPSNGRLRMRGLSRQNYLVTATVKSADGRSERWNNDIDFRAYHRAALLLCVDSYDRVRGRVLSIEAPPKQ